MEPIDEGQPFGVLVDYAHTPDSLENVLEAARRLTAGRLISVFGCGGDRDPLKRPLMGRAGAELSDLPIVTSDNPRSEDPVTIIEGMLAGVPADRRDLPELACGHLAANNPLALPVTTLIDGQLRFNPANEWTGGGLVSNPQDLARWAKLLYEGKAMPFDYLDELLATSPQDSDKPTRYGLGVFVTDNSKLGRSYGHGGFFPGYLTRMAYYPKQRVAIALQFNTDHPKAGALDMLTELTGEVLAVCGVSP